MKKNLGGIDRALRGAAGMAMMVGAFLAPLTWDGRLGLGMVGGYVLSTALAGACVGYRVLGMSTCRLGTR